MLISARKKKSFGSNQTGQLFIWALNSIKSSFIATMNISVCQHFCVPGSFRNPRGKEKTGFWLSERAGVSVCPLLHRSLLAPNWGPSVSYYLFYQCPCPLLGTARLGKAQLPEQLASSKHGLGKADNPGTERCAFSQTFTPPGALAAPLASLTHKLTALGLSALTSFLFSPGTEAGLRSITLFLPSHSLLSHPL